MAYRKKDEGGFWTSWGLIIFLFIVGLSPLAVILMLVKLFKKDRREMEDVPSLQAQTRVTVDTRINRPQRENQRVNVNVQVEDQPVRQESRSASAMRQITKSPRPKKSTVRWLTIGGGFLAFVGLLQFDGPMGFSDLMTALAFLLGGGAMLFKSFLMQKDGKRYAKYLTIIADREAVSVEELARTTGESVKQVEKDLEDMADKGFFGEGAYLHRELGYLFLSSQADRDWQEKHREAEQEARKKAPEKAAEEAADTYSEILRNIRRANDEIADPVLSAKIDQLEDVTRRIFQAVKDDPRKAEKIDTFLNYYLPTTQKLLDSYAQFEAAGVEGENLSQAKARISSTMDMILKGFSNQLDQLYKTDAMDVDSDIRVMETMLRRDTGTVADDFGAVRRGGGRSGGTAGGASGGTEGGTNGKPRFGQSFEEDFGGAAVQRAPEEQ